MELSELIESVDILEYISQYTEFTEKNGEYWALSPFKDEKTPSFSVRKETNSFYDFSSGIGGNVLTFIRYYDKCGYAEAIEKLKNYSGVDGNVVARKKLATVEVAKRFMPPKKCRSSQNRLCFQTIIWNGMKKTGQISCLGARGYIQRFTRQVWRVLRQLFG